jgi:hypothetical protein
VPWSSRLKSVIRKVVPPRLLAAVLRRPGGVGWGGLRRLSPVSTNFGWERGQPIDRYYIENFLDSRREDVRGTVLEVADPTYTRRFGGDRVERAEILHAVAGTPGATVIGDLATGDGIPRAAFDCIILTQTLLVIYDVRGAVRCAYEALRPGGVLLATLPGISQISRHDADRWGDYWRFTPQSAERLFGDAYGPANVEVVAHGNVLAACAFLQGHASHELTRDELDYVDPDYPVIITVRARRAG